MFYYVEYILARHISISKKDGEFLELRKSGKTRKNIMYKGRVVHARSGWFDYRPLYSNQSNI